MGVNTADQFERLRKAALAQPGAVERRAGIIKVQCPECRVEGHDQHRDNAALFPNGKFGCASAKDTAQGRAHWEAIGVALGAVAENLSAGSERAAPEPELEVIELHDLLARSYREDPGIVGSGVLPSCSLAVLGAPGKVGKTFLVLNLVLSRARGRPWLGFPTRTGRTLIASAETPPPYLQRRIGILLTHAGKPPRDTIYFITARRLKLDRGEGINCLRRCLDTIRPDLLVLDPFARFFSSDENSARDMTAFIDQLGGLLEEYAPLCILLVHHTGWGGARLRGSSTLFDAADSILMLEKAHEGFELNFDLRHGEAPKPLRLARNAHGWYTVGPPAPGRAEPSSSLLAVPRIVSRASKPLRWTELCQTLQKAEGISRKAAERRIAKALTQGLIVSRNGIYALPVDLPASSESSADECPADLFPR